MSQRRMVARTHNLSHIEVRRNKMVNITPLVFCVVIMLSARNKGAAIKAATGPSGVLNALPLKLLVSGLRRITPSGTSLLS